MYQVNWSGLSETICSEKDLSAHKSVIGQPLLVPQVKNHNSYKNIALHYFIPVYMVMCTTIQSTASGFRDMYSAKSGDQPPTCITTQPQWYNSPSAGMA